VLIVQATPTDGQYLADALRAQGLQVDVADPQAAPLDMDSLRDYATVILANVPASALAEGQLTALQSYVQSYGGGLVVSGGDQAFGPGGYARTPLEDMLPVDMGLRGKSVSASTALILVIDTSGSMGQDEAGSNKMELAKQAAMAAAQSLGQYDQIGVLAFEDQPRWVIEPTSAADLNAVDQAIGTMQPGGGTEIYPALQAAYEGLLPVSATVKHIVLLTDGEAPNGAYAELTQQMHDAGMTLSTIGIGADADTNLLQQLAQQGNGAYYDGNDPFDLPQLVLKDAQQVQRAAIVEQDVQPRVVSDSPALAGLDSLPMLRGYVATTPKPQASVALVSGQLDPILSEWQYGLGRVMAWTSDANNKWSAQWVDWPDFGRFWAQVVERAGRPPDDPNRQLNVAIEGSQARITLDAQTGADDPQRHYLNFEPTTATLVDPRGAPLQVALPQIAPGRYEATTPVEDDGVYQLDVQQTDPATNAVAQQSSGFVVPYSPEYAAAGTDETFLESLTGRTGGQVIQDPAQALLHDLPAVGAPRSLWPYLMALAAVLMVFDVGVRRVRFGAREMHGAYAVVRRRLGYVDEPKRATVSLSPRGVTAVRARSAASTKQTAAPPRPVPEASHAPVAHDASRGSRLLAARQRAVRR
jgi:Ca-activated chloride channel homolog